MIKRALSKRLLSYARTFPVVTLTGPRQSGKTTLCKSLFAKKLYFSLENLDVRMDAARDPRSFLEQCLRRGAVLDEIHRAPELLSYIQGYVDEMNKPGLFILTGSQNFQLLSKVTQSLAGRTALATLLPFSYEELYTGKSGIGLDRILYAGFYPRIHDKKLNPTDALKFYVGTYLERDIRSLINVKDLSKFEIFLKLCASRTGQILNVAHLGNDCGVTHNTAKSWLSVLAASYVIHLVPPHHQNFRKRLVKSPKLYFVDVGLASYLLDIHSVKHLAVHPLRGPLFETYVVGELLKRRLNAGKSSNLFYFRDNIGNEVDLILDYGYGKSVQPVEIKLGKTVTTDMFKGLEYYKKLNPKKSKKSVLIYGGDHGRARTFVDVIGYKNLHTLSV